MKMAMAGKEQRKIITAIGRELLGFIWAIGIKTESACTQKAGGITGPNAKKQKLSK